MSECEWYVWNVETGTHVPGTYSMEEAQGMADELNEVQPTDGIGWTANPVRAYVAVRGES